MVSTNQNPNDVMPRRASCYAMTSASSMPHAPRAGLSRLRSSLQTTSLALLLALLATVVPNFAFAAHLKTIDGKWFDFVPSGVFSLLKSGRLQVQVAQKPQVGAPGVGSIYGVAIAHGESLMHFVLQGNKLVVTRGSSNASSLVVFRSTVNPSSYRVFPKTDPASYIDISTNSPQSGNYLNVAAVASLFIRTQGVDGLLGNGNGNPLDDVADNAQLVKLFQLPDNNNLFTCTPGNCQFVPLNAADKSANLSVKAPQGYSKVDIAKLPVSTIASNR
ncbi:hypothetical protein [Myxococcus sp. AB056]|uniref:hypothetical protein n=1 Tax=Myxococcus sp. AB056 TaxID=2562792 RepID=UPI00114634DB|nr:hypothetical protein [Myxococcus sp. AB056]